MPRARGRVPAHARHRKVIKAAKGYYGRRKNTFRTAQAAVVKAGVNAYKGRKQKKRNFRSLWIQRINAAVRSVDANLTYSRFIDGLTKAGLGVDRNDEAFARKVVHELCETLALLSTKQVLRRQLYVFEEQLGSVGRVETKLLELATAAETARVLGFDHHQRHALGTGMRICLGDDDDQAGVLAIGDEGL